MVLYYLYILYSEKADKYYVGYSTDPWRRVNEHNFTGLNTYTSKYRPWKLMAVFKVGTSEVDAINIERFIKKQKSRELLKKLITPNFQLSGYLSQLVRVPHVRG